MLFDNKNISDKELFTASALHDVAKRESFSNVTMRIFAALLIAALPAKAYMDKAKLKTSFAKKIYAYKNHSVLSADLLEELGQSEFVCNCARYHHSGESAIRKNANMADELILFIEADML